MPTQKILNRIVTKKDGVSYVYKIGNVDGYLNPTDGLFYEESTYETPIQGTDGMLYVDLSENKTYRYDELETEFIVVGGGDMLKSVYDTDNDGKVDSAENADTVNGHTVAKDVPSDAVFTDTVYDDTEIRGEIADKVDKVSGKGLSTEDYTSAEKTKLSGIETGAEVNTIESISLNGVEVTPDANKNVALTVITKAVNDLVNYYLKSETYSKTEVDDIVTAIKNSRFEVVATLPTTDIKTNVIYLVPKSEAQTSNAKDEYINLDGTTAGWEKIGDTEIDLSGYVTTEALNTALANYTTTADLTTLLAAKQDTLTFDNVPTENSNNPVKSGGVYADEKSIYEVMGQMGAKNLIPYDYLTSEQVVNGVTVTPLGDGTYKLNGTATAFADIRLSPFGTSSYDKCMTLPEGVYALNGSATSGYSGDYETSPAIGIIYNDGTNRDNLGFTRDTDFSFVQSNESVRYEIKISFWENTVFTNAIFKPMLRLASDTDDTWQPYAQTNYELTQQSSTNTDAIADIVNVYGAKNLLPYPYYHGESRTSYGITYTVNTDGSVTASGTSTGDKNSRYYFTSSTATLSTLDYLEKGKTYTLSSGVDSSSNNCYMEFALYNTSTSSWLVYRTNNASGTVTFTMPSDFSIYSYATFYIICPEGVTVSNLTFYPMLRMASITDDTYEPYAMTNQELTKSVQDIESDISETSETQDIISDAWSSSKTYAAGEYCISGNKLYKCLVANTGTEPPNTTYWEETTCAEEFSELNSKLSYVGMIIHSTKLSTLAQVQAIYGANTTWIQHSGYILRGATSGVVANSATKTGGNDGAWLMQHSHSVTYNNTGNGTLAAYGTGNGNWGDGNNQRGDTTITINNAGSVASTNTTANIPNYKSVYIWERTA